MTLVNGSEKSSSLHTHNNSQIVAKLWLQVSEGGVISIWQVYGHFDVEVQIFELPRQLITAERRVNSQRICVLSIRKKTYWEEAR
jgi:hypothetical protein